MQTRITPQQTLRAVILASFGLLAFGGPAHADPTLPPRKPGFWQTTMTMKMMVNGQAMNGPMGGPGVTMANCIDAATDLKELRHMGDTHGHCGTPDFAGSGGVYTISNTCATPNGGTMVVHGTITYDSDTQLHVDIAMKSDQMNGTMRQDQKWIGACPAGVVPGDVGMMVNGNFQKMTNINDAPQ